MRLDAIVNRGEYFSAHYLAEVLPKDLKKKDGLFAQWTEREKAARTDAEGAGATEPGELHRAAAVTPRQGLKALHKPYFADRPFFADFDTSRTDDVPATAAESAEWRKRLHELHGEVLRALGFEAEPRNLTVERADGEHAVAVAYADAHLVATECGWAAEVDAALDDTRAGRLLTPVTLSAREEITSGTKLASWLFTGDNPPRYVLILAGGIVILADRATWGEGRYLAVNLDVALGRNDLEELSLIGALFGAGSLLPPAEGGTEPLAELLTKSRNHAVGVSKELREGIKESVELIAQEVLDRLGQQDVRPEDIGDPTELAKELGREALRYLYRILFLLYAEARPELGILPTDDADYGRGYSLARLGDLISRPLDSEEARTGFHLYESLDLLFRLVNHGHRPHTGEVESDTEGLRFEPMRSELFDPKAIELIAKHRPLDDEGRTVDTRLTNACLYQVLSKLMKVKGRRNKRGGFISYAQLGINQLGAVYEGLMSYTGFIATEPLLEVAKDGDPTDGSWMIPASREDAYPAEVIVRRVDDDGRKTAEYVRYAPGSFVYRLAARDRQTSASYYTPESLTNATVQLTLKYRLDQDDTTTTAREILDWKICEPALGSGAFLNEAINQVAAEYLKRRQQELGVEIDPEKHEFELQKTKAYIALHNCYGVDLNDTAVELAEVSLWLNVMHPGLQAPWFGLHLRRGNSLIGAGHKVYDPSQLPDAAWLKATPEDLPLSTMSLPEGKIYHFLLPAEGWGAVVAGMSDARKLAQKLAPDEVQQLGTWRRGIRKKIAVKAKNGRPTRELQRLQAVSRRAEYLWSLVVTRLRISEGEISRKIDVWGADWITQPEQAVPKEKVYDDLTAAGTPYWRLKLVMDTWCALWFWPLDQAGMLDGSDPYYAQHQLLPLEPVESAHGSDQGKVEPDPVQIGFDQLLGTEPFFRVDGEQLELNDVAVEQVASAPKSKQTRRQRSKVGLVRSVIALNDLNDWLDFAEAVLGRLDVDDETLVTEFSKLDDLEDYEDDLPYWMAMDTWAKLNERFPWLWTVREVAEAEAFFHWELQYAQIFHRGGFDLQVGNPPWVRPRWEESAVLAEFEPWFVLRKKADDPEVDRRRAELMSSSSAKDFVLTQLTSTAAQVAVFGSIQTFPLLSGTQPDLYRAFMCQTWLHSGPSGTAGMLHSDTHFTGDNEGALRSESYHRLRIHGDFVNSTQRFFPEPVGHATHFGIHIYGEPKEIGFDHLSWLVSVEALLFSAEHDGSGEIPGIRYKNAEFDIRPHRSRVIHVTDSVLKVWRRMMNEDQVPVDQARLLFPVSTAEAGAIAALASYPERLGALKPQLSPGYHESGAKKARLMEYNKIDPSTGLEFQPDSWRQVILKNVQLGVANPIYKRHDANSNDPYGRDLASIEPDFVPDTEYIRSPGRIAEFLAKQERWTNYEVLDRLRVDAVALDRATRQASQIPGVDTPEKVAAEVDRLLMLRAARRSTTFPRLAWRRRMASNGERMLVAAMLPPGPAHVDAIHSLAMPSDRLTILVSGFWASLPLDYFVRTIGREDLRKSGAWAMPSPLLDHPLVGSLLLRTMRLNCLTAVYRKLWSKIYAPDWEGESWAVSWPHLRPLNGISETWNPSIPLRTEFERRAALVEIDAIVAVWLGIDVDSLIAAYKGKFPVLQKYDAASWFDSSGSKLANYARTIGLNQSKNSWDEFQKYLESPEDNQVPVGYTAPFYKADREAEYRQAHAVFSARLSSALDSGMS
ncbi:hypothetical protein IU450_32920 [Nocardia abscessus]|uniref:hypothetical protein n=1 Tax=Nocardia abscessus TaxID=120957 RepID=UPI001894D981|nr:hypothetical protein [Nocardia abscessus]MBF6340662.1 hypothetical protein [Nocardia abscessus]